MLILRRVDFNQNGFIHNVYPREVWFVLDWIYITVIYYQATHGRAPFLLKSPSIRGLMGNDGYIWERYTSASRYIDIWLHIKCSVFHPLFVDTRISHKLHKMAIYLLGVRSSNNCKEPNLLRLSVLLEIARMFNMQQTTAPNYPRGAGLKT